MFLLLPRLTSALYQPDIFGGGIPPPEASKDSSPITWKFYPKIWKLGASARKDSRFWKNVEKVYQFKKVLFMYIFMHKHNHLHFYLCKKVSDNTTGIIKI